MQQRLVAWGDIGTDHKALIAIEFVAATHTIFFRAYPEEMVNKDLQHQLFTVWKNGGEFEFPEELPIWEIKAEVENILPEEIKLHKPELLVSAQKNWNKKLELEDNFKLLGEKLHVLELELDGIKEFNQEIWNKTRDLWDEIAAQKKEGHLGWTQADELKIRINSVFDGLKAFRRLNKERNYDESNALLKVFQKQINDCEEQLIYPDEWNKIFNTLQGIQKEMKENTLIFKHQRILMKQVNGVFNDLRKYRRSDQINHLEVRISGLERVLHGVEAAIQRDEKSYDNQFEKMKHYTRGKMSDEDIASQLKYIKDQTKAKRKKIKSIERTLKNLDKRLESLKNPPKPKPAPAAAKPDQSQQNDVVVDAETDLTPKEASEQAKPKPKKAPKAAGKKKEPVAAANNEKEVPPVEASIPAKEDKAIAAKADEKDTPSEVDEVVASAEKKGEIPKAVGKKKETAPADNSEKEVPSIEASSPVKEEKTIASKTDDKGTSPEVDEVEASAEKKVEAPDPAKQEIEAVVQEAAPDPSIEKTTESVIDTVADDIVAGEEKDAEPIIETEEVIAETAQDDENDASSEKVDPKVEPKVEIEVKKDELAEVESAAEPVDASENSTETELTAEAESQPEEKESEDSEIAEKPATSKAKKAKPKSRSKVSSKESS